MKDCHTIPTVVYANHGIQTGENDSKKMKNKKDEVYKKDEFLSKRFPKRSNIFEAEKETPLIYGILPRQIWCAAVQADKKENVETNAGCIVVSTFFSCGECY